jgi:predicted Zn-dependent protease
MNTAKTIVCISASLIACSLGCQSGGKNLPPVAQGHKQPVAHAHRPPGAQAQKSPASQAPQAQQVAARPITTDYDRTRDQTDYQAAVARWESGDSKGCRAILVGLLQRAPEHRDANLLFAELCLLEDSPSRGLPAAQKVCRQDPRDAQAQHLRGLLLEAMGRKAEAVQAYALAVEYAPQDEIYVASLDAATAQPTLDSTFLAEVQPQQHPEEGPRVTPRPIKRDFHLAALEGDEPETTDSVSISDLDE